MLSRFASAHNPLLHAPHHEAHHRGQICMLAHQLGFRLSSKVDSEIWNWKKLLNDADSYSA